MGRTPCCDKNGLKKGPWTPEEDHKLIEYIKTHGPGNWRNLPRNAGLQRCGKSCRLRWTNYLRPDIKRGRFSFEEEETIIQLHSILGNKWSAIAARLPGRTDNEIKNYWNTHIRKRLLRMGIDPVTHTPRLDLMDLSSLLNSAQVSNLANLLSLQTLVNPEALRLLAALVASSNSSNGTPESSLQQKLQDNQLLMMNAHMQNRQQSPIFQPDHHHPIQQNSSIPEAPATQQNNNNNVSSSSASFLSNQSNSLPMQGSFWEQFLMSSASGNGSIEENLASPSEGFAALQSSHYGYINNNNNGSDLTGSGSDSSGKSSSFDQSLKSSSSQHFNFDSVLSTPISSPAHLNSSSRFINSTGEDERESFCSNLMKFEIPESLDFESLL